MRVFTYFTLLLFIITCRAINRPVYKIILTQKGFAQFLQYDIDTPPLREFTFCTWMKFRDFTRDQTLFNYIVHGNDHILSLWLDSGGRHMKIAVNGRISSSNAIDLAIDVWQHVCLSYQSDYGAWAIYHDSRLVSCEVAPSLQGYVLPAGGSVIIGYGFQPGGFEGEIFGANMILVSTIERNHTIKRNPKFRQKQFRQNKVIGSKDNHYVVLGDMQSATSHQDFETTTSLPSSTQSHVSIKTPFSIVDHDVGIDLLSEAYYDDLYKKKYILDDRVTIKPKDDDKISFWNIMDDVNVSPRFREKQLNHIKANANPTISIYETSPSVNSVSEYSKFSEFFLENLSVKPMNTLNINNMSKYTRKTVKLPNDAISNIKSPSNDKNFNPYSRTSFNFAKNVLNFLKNNNINIKVDHKRIPPTIPLFKISDSFPYASDVKVKSYTPYIFQRKQSFDKPYKIKKRDVHNQQINVQIINKDDVRKTILKSHSSLSPVNVKVTNRGESNDNNNIREYRDTVNSVPELTLSDVFKPKSFSTKANKNSLPIAFRKNSINTILPFIKSNDHIPKNHKPEVNITQNEVFSRSVFNPNKWHNTKSYSNDYAPRRTETDFSGIKTNNNHDQIYETLKKNLPSVRLKYIPHNHKIVQNYLDRDILKGRDLALEVSNISDPFSDSVSILKYNHGFLPTINNKIKKDSEFNKRVKIGNALNERAILGDDEVKKHKSFIGGNEKVPDINTYRSDIDKVNEQVPPSLSSKICKNLELFDRLLYIQPDGSIDVTHILSPVKEKNLGIIFILQNYKTCALKESIIEHHPLLFIDWSNTPVRLFGGAKPKKTTDLCGFF